MRVTLLLNLAVLVVNFLVALGATETQVHVLRTTARTALARPLPPQPPRVEAADLPLVGRVPATRLVKYLKRCEELDRLSPRQVRALCLALEYCCGELSRGGEALRAGRHDGARARRLLGDLTERVQRNVTSTLRAADLAEGELLARLVRIVVASAG